MNENLLFLTKDALYRKYLPTYGNKYWKTPNIDELVERGTVFNKYITGAPSTIMSNMCMFTGLYAHESELDDYNFSGIHFCGESFWTEAEKKGYECHIIWDEAWKSVFRAEDRYYCYGENTKIHYIEGLRQGVGAHYVHDEFLTPNEALSQKTISTLFEEINQILENAKKPVFLWLHVPHVINGRTGYGDDIDLFDEIVGKARSCFEDDNIFISADHGNMNGIKGKFSYGHDVYEPSANIPLITPRINNLSVCDSLVSNIDIKTIIFERRIPMREFVYCDSAFYAQANRKLAIYKENYKYIFNKINGSEELYDLNYDPDETCNIIEDYVFDVDRNVKSPLRELYFYPYWDRLDEIRALLRA